MATINASIGLTDNMTRVFRSISSAMDGVINLFEQLDRQTEDGINNPQLVEARRRVDEVRSSVARLEVGIDEATHSQDRFTDSVRESETASNKLLDTLKTIVITYAGIRTVQTVLDTSTELINVEARLNNINDGTQTTAELMDKVYASANRSYAGFTDTASAVAKLASQTGDLFASTDQAIAFTELLNKSFAIGGTSAEGKASAMLQLTQAMSSGVLRGEEFNALNENAGQLVQTIADYMGVEKGAMKELASEGKITADIIKNAIFSAGEDIDETFNNMPITFADVKTRIGNLALQMFTPMWKELEKLFNSDEVKQIIAGLASAFQTLAKVVTFVVRLFVSGLNIIVNNWSVLGPLFVALAGAVLIYAGAVAWATLKTKLLRVAQIVLGVTEGVLIGIKALLTTGSLSEAMATGVATAATWGLTAAEYALLVPLLIIIAIIVAVIGAIFLLVKAYDYLTGSSTSALGVIVGAFYAMGAGIYNVFAWIWNMFVEVAEFFATVFSDPIYYVRKLFGELGKFFLRIGSMIMSGLSKIASLAMKGVESAVNLGIDLINTFISAYNAIPFLDNVSKLKHVKLDTDIDLGNFDEQIDGIDNWIGEFKGTQADFSDSAAEYKDLEEYYNAGYDKGKEISDSISGMFNLTNQADALDDDIGSEYDYSGYLDDATTALDNSGMSDGIDDVASNTGSIADSMASAEEDLKYLIDVAKKNRVEQVTNVAVTVPISMSNNISNGTDLTGAIDYMTEQLTVKVSEAIATSAEGVHQ